MALQQLQSGEDAEKVLNDFSHRLTQKLLHPTSLLLREAVKENDPEYFDWMKENLQQILANNRIPKKNH